MNAAGKQIAEMLDAEVCILLKQPSGPIDLAYGRDSAIGKHAVTLPTAQDDLRNVLELSMSDNSEGWDLSGDGTWHRRPANPTDPHIHLQESLLRRIIGKAS